MVISNTVKLSSFFIIFFVCLTACFELEDVPFQEVKEPDVQIPWIEFFDSLDTLFLQNRVYLNLEFETNELVFGYEVYLDSTLIESQAGQPTGFSFRTQDYPDGFSKLSIVLFVKSNTESIADQLGGEAVTITYERVVLIDNKSIIDQPVIKKFDIVGNELLLVFESYKDFGFEKWVITNENRSRLGESTNPRDTSFIIPDYGGEPITLTLNLYAKNQQTSASLSYSFDYGLDIYQTEDSVKFSWNPVPFNSFAGMQISFDTFFEEVTGTKYSMPIPEGTFPFDYEVQVRPLSAVRFNPEILAKHYIRSNRVQLPYDEGSRYTFRNDSILTEFYPNVLSGIYGRYEAINYLIIARPNEQYDSLVVLARTENVIFSQDYKKIYQLEEYSFSQLDTMTLQPFRTTQYETLLGHGGVKTIYPGNGNKIGFVGTNHNQIQVYDFDSNEIVFERSLECDDFANRNRSYDLRANNIFISKPTKSSRGQRKVLWNSSEPDFTCFNFDYTVWHKGATTIRFVQSGTGRTRFHNLITDEYQDITFDPVIEPEPFVEGDYLFGDAGDTYQVYDLNTMAVVHEFKDPTQCCLRAPQLKGRRLSITLGRTLYYTDL